MNRTRFGALMLVSVAFLPELALARFPSNPTSMAECDAVAQQYRQAAQREHDQAVSIANQRSRERAPQGCFSNDHCRNSYYGRQSELHQMSQRHFRERDRIQDERRAGEKSCRSVARLHEQQADQQRRMSQDTERRNRQAYEDNQRRQYAAQLQESSRQQERNQPRVIASTPSGYYDNRNQPRVVQSPQQQAYQAQEQRNAALSQQQAQAQALTSVFGAFAQMLSSPRSPSGASTSTSAPASSGGERGDALAASGNTSAAAPPETSGAGDSNNAEAGGTVANALRDGWTQVRNFASSIFNPPDATKPVAPQMERGREMADENNEARRRMLDGALNPGGVRNPGVDNTVEAVQEVNQRMDRGGPLVTQMQNDAYAATGSVANNTLGQLDQALSQSSGSGNDAESGVRGTQSTSASVAPVQVAATPASPEEACGRRRLFSLNQCMARECEKPHFKEHPQCEPFQQRSSAND